jgi:hypothetical protein
MICRIIRANEGHNPAYVEGGDAAIVTLPDGSHPTREMPEFLTWPVGTLIEHRHAGILCCYGYANAPPIAEPADEEAQAYFASNMAGRADRIEVLRKMWEESSPRTPRGKHLRELAIAYGLTTEDAE